MGDQSSSVPEVVPAQVSAKKQLLPTLPPTDELNRMAAYAHFISHAKFVPESYRGDVATVFFVIARGHEMGLHWGHAIESFYDTGHGLGMEGQALLSCLLSRGFRVMWSPQAEIREKEVAECQICRPECKCPMDENGQWVVCRCGSSRRSSFTMAEAKTIIVGYKKNAQGNTDWNSPKFLAGKDNWKNYWPDMLMWRSFSRSANFVASDVRAGMPLRDEIEELPPMQREERVAGFQASIDESKIPPELQSALMDAAGPANQGWAREQLARISREAERPAAMRAMIRDAIEEAAKIRAGQAERRRAAETAQQQSQPETQPSPPAPIQTQSVAADTPTVTGPQPVPDKFPDLFN